MGRILGALEGFLDPVEKPLIAILDAAPVVRESDNRLPEQPRRRLRGVLVAPEQRLDPLPGPLQDPAEVLPRRAFGCSLCHGGARVACYEKKVPQCRNRRQAPKRAGTPEGRTAGGIRRSGYPFQRSPI